MSAKTGQTWGTLHPATLPMFLKEFADDTPWLHLDIAGTAWSDDAKPLSASGPTGVALRSIVEWIRSFGI